jgi:hypothetical protein
MKKIEKKILLNLRKKLRLKDKIILWIMRKYTYKIYRIGFNDGYYFKK